MGEEAGKVRQSSPLSRACFRLTSVFVLLRRLSNTCHSHPQARRHNKQPNNHRPKNRAKYRERAKREGFELCRNTEKGLVLDFSIFFFHPLYEHQLDTLINTTSTLSARKMAQTFSGSLKTKRKGDLQSAHHSHGSRSRPPS